MFNRSFAHRKRALRSIAALLGGLLILAGCSPASTATTSTSSAPAAPAAVKTIRIGLETDREPPSPAMFGAGGSGSSGLEPYLIFHASLTMFDPSGAVIPWLAQKVPTIQDGDWKVNPTGGMEVTWKLKPNLAWHDGAKLTADDFVFGWQINLDPDLTAVPGELNSITSLKAVDDQTLVATWKTTSIGGGISGYDGIPAAPRHLLGDLYAAGDKTAFTNSPKWSTEFVGLGPYRMTRWERGAFIEGEAFDKFVGGKPKVDKVLLKFIGDANALVANLISGDIDILPLGAQLDVGPMVAVRQAWQGNNKGTTGVVAKGVRALYIQFRDPSVPWTDLRVRQAMLHSIDRESIVATLEEGLTQRADFYVPIGDPVLDLAQKRGLTQYPFDLTRAQRLLADAGYTRTGNGMAMNASGKTIDMPVATSNEGTNPQEAAIVANMLVQAGFNANPAPYAQTAANRNEQAHNIKALLVKPWNFATAAPGSLRVSQIGTEANKWAGNNYGGYTNPAYDNLYTTYANEFDVSKRAEALFNIIKVLDDELPALPIFYVPQTFAFSKALVGPGVTAVNQAASSWNISTWDIS